MNASTALTRLATASCLVAAALAAPFAAFAADYPSKPITLVIPFPPGGATDVLGRVIGQRIGQELGQPVVIRTAPVPAPSSVRPTWPRRRPTATRCW